MIGKPQVVALTKQDLPDARAAFELFGPALAEAVAAISPDSTLLSISSATNSHVRDLLARAVTVLDALPPLEVTEIAPVLTMTDAENDAISVTRIPGGFRVVSRLLEKKAAMTRWDLDDSVLAFQRSLERSGVGPALEAQHVQPGDIVQIGDHELEWGI